MPDEARGRRLRRSRLWRDRGQPTTENKARRVPSEVRDLARFSSLTRGFATGALAASSKFAGQAFKFGTKAPRSAILN